MFHALNTLVLAVASDPCGEQGSLWSFVNAVFTRCDGFWI